MKQWNDMTYKQNMAYPLLIPAAVSFYDIFKVSQHRDDPIHDIRGRRGITIIPVCMFFTPTGIYRRYVQPVDAVMEYLSNDFGVGFDDRVAFKAIVWDEPTQDIQGTLIVADCTSIIGSKWLGFVDTTTLPGPDDPRTGVL